MTSNFDFLTKDRDSTEIYKKATEAEKLYTQGLYSQEFISIRIIIENIVKMIADFEFIDFPDYSTLNDYLRELKSKQILNKQILESFQYLKKYGNNSSHTLDSYSKDEALKGLVQLDIILVWVANTYMDQHELTTNFLEPQAEHLYQTSERKLIYVQTAKNDKGLWKAYAGSEKVGDASIDDYEMDSRPNSDDLRDVAEHRINQYMNTAGVPHELQWAELAYRRSDRTWFRDYDVHEVLRRSGIKKNENIQGDEWFMTDVETVRKAIAAVKDNRSAIYVDEHEHVTSKEIILRPEQLDAIEKTKNVFKSKDKMLWNAKMRFGKTLSALQLIKDQKYERVLIMTHRPVVSDSWFEDFQKIGMNDAGYTYGSKDKGVKLEDIVNIGKYFIYFASIQDLRGSTIFGGKAGNKNEIIAETTWDLVIIDEAHEGTMTDLATQVINGILKPETNLLELSGTPFNIMDQYEDDQVYTWDYVMEQEAKQKWSVDHPNERNPYEGLPKVSMYTFEMKNSVKGSEFISTDGKTFNFKEFFRVDDDGNFIYENKINNFLDNITKEDASTNYPFSTKKFRSELRHTLWLMPGIKEAAAMKNLMDKHDVFGKEYDVINVVNNGDTKDGTASRSDLERVRRAITNKPSETKTITLTVRKLTTGVNVKEWTAVIFLSNTNSATTYLQAAFRAQTPFSDEKLGMKTNSYIFDFAPDRALTVMAETTSLSTGAGKRISSDQKDKMQRLMNFLPIIGENGQGMQEYKIDNLLTKLKRVYAEKAVRNGFDDDSLYSDELLMNLDKADLEEFNDLKKLVGSTKAEKRPMTIPVNSQGLDDEEYNKAIKATKKTKQQRTLEEQEALDKLKSLKKQRSTMISVLRGISIRIPMMIYGMNVDIEDDVDIEKFIKNVDEYSWLEFMPAGVTKGKFRTFAKYYDPEIFIEAGRIIRHRVKELDSLSPLERVEELALIFGIFKNPDKETVLTPWRVVNMHLGNTIGGWSFYDESYKETTVSGISAEHWVKKDETDFIYKDDVHILEINSKTGLYPLYIAATLYKKAFDEMNNAMAGKFSSVDITKIWDTVLKNNVFVIAKTPMAKTITERTLAGYRQININVKYFDGIVENLQKNTDDISKQIEKEFDQVQFDVIIGNPPYQESDNESGTGSAKPIYHRFMQLAKSLNPSYISLITPSVWFTGGKGLDSYRKDMLNDEHLKSIYNYVTPKEVFPSANLRGGVSYYLWDKNYNNKKDLIEINTIKNGKVMESGLRPVTVDGIEILISSNKSFEIIQKLISDKSISLDKNSDSMIEKLVSVRNPFGFSTTFTKTVEFKTNDKGLSNSVRILASGSKVGYIERNSITRNKQWIDVTKVLTPFANNIGTDLQDDNLNTIVAGKNTIVTETYLVIGADLNLNEKSATNLAIYLKTKFVRFLISLAKANQNGTKSTYAFVPIQKFDENSDINWQANVDEQLFKKYGLNAEQIEHINHSIQDMG